jgi:hypothetical protein
MREPLCSSISFDPDEHTMLIKCRLCQGCPDHRSQTLRQRMWPKIHCVMNNMRHEVSKKIPSPPWLYFWVTGPMRKRILFFIPGGELNPAIKMVLWKEAQQAL